MIPFAFCLDLQRAGISPLTLCDKSEGDFEPGPLEKRLIDPATQQSLHYTE